MNPTSQSRLRSSCLPFPTPLPPSLPPFRQRIASSDFVPYFCSGGARSRPRLISRSCVQRHKQEAKQKKKKKKGLQRCEIFNSSQITGANRTLVTPLFVCFPCRETPDLQEKKKNMLKALFVFCFCVFTVREERPAH